MPHALIRSLVVRPFFSIDLCFSQVGILKTRADAAKLGKQDVLGFDLNSLILDHLKETVGTGPATRLKYTAEFIRTTLTPLALYIQRNERQYSDLETATQRWIVQFLEKYAHIAALKTEWKTRHESKLKHLTDLRAAIVERHQTVKAMMEADEEKDARAPETDSLYYKHLNPPPKDGASSVPERTETITRTRSQPVGMFHSETVMQVTNDQRSQSTGGAAGKGEALHTNVTKPTFTFPTLVPGEFDFPVHIPLFNLFESQVNFTDHFTHRTRRLDGEYRNPYQEDIARFNREIASLEQEIVETITFNQRLDHLNEIWSAEFDAIYEEVRRAQVAYIDTFLIPPPTLGVDGSGKPISGVITAINKDVGECTQPGEAVLRIENARKALLAGLLVYRGRLAVAQDVRLDFRGLFEEPVTTELPPAPAPAPPGSGRLDGKIVTIRGHDSDNDLWDVVIECVNWDASLLPINYTFESTPDRYGSPGAELQGAVVEIL